MIQKTNPFQTQNKATKSFRFELAFWNKAKTKPPSPLERMRPKNKAISQIRNQK